MKKIIISVFLFILNTFLSFGTAIPSERAMEYARNFFGGRQAELAFSQLEPQTKAGISPALYAFNNPSGGWVILSADDCATAVLAHSSTGSISLDGMPLNMKVYLKQMTENIAKASAAHFPATRAIQSSWNSNGIATKAGTTQRVLNTANWDQYSPYNNTVCTKVTSGGVAVSGLYTGCVATAMAIFMQYMKYPSAPSGTIPSYTTDSKRYSVPSVNLSSYGAYDWSKMPNSTPVSISQVSAVADLMFHCGAAVQMDYTKNGSGAFSENVPTAMTKYFGYSPAAHHEFRYNYSSNEWLDIISAEIDEERPVIYTGTDIEKQEGHEFIVDGYNSNNEVHVNWGWGGSCNGWFAICYLGDKNKSGVNDVFNYMDGAVLGLIPDKSSGKSCPELFMYSYGNDPGLRITSGKIGKGSPFYLNAVIYSLDAERAYSGPVVAAVVSADGSIKQKIGDEKNITVEKSSEGYLAETEIANYKCTITCDIIPGDFISLYYKDGLDSWRRIGGYSEATDIYGETYTVSRISAVENLAYLYVPSEINTGQVIYFDLVTGKKLPKTILWYSDGTANTTGFVKFKSSGTHTIKAVITYTDGSKETITRNISVK